MGQSSDHYKNLTPSKGERQGNLGGKVLNYCKDRG